MRHVTKGKIEEFYLHDSPVREIYVEEAIIRLVLDFACVSKDHPGNPHGIAQVIEPCEFEFSEVQEQLVLVWNEDEHKYMSHPGLT